MMMGSLKVRRKGRYSAMRRRWRKDSTRISTSARYLSSPVSSRRCAAFHFKRMGA